MKKLLYVADTAALARYLEDALPQKADEIFQRCETGKAHVIVPSIVIAELIYVSMKGRIKTQDPKATLLELLGDMEVLSYLEQKDMNHYAWRIFLDLRVPELHDRLICAVALANNAEAIITNDDEMAGLKTIW